MKPLNKFEQQFNMDHPRPPRVLAIALGGIAFSAMVVGFLMPVIAFVLFLGLGGVAFWLHRRGDSGNRNLVFFFQGALVGGFIFGVWYYHALELIR